METTTITKWAIDKAHSEIIFKAKHLVISTVTGQFTKFDGAIETEGEGLVGANAWFKADIDSISTNSTDRDNHLKSKDFFDAENYPTVEFQSRFFDYVADGEYSMVGDLTIRGITRVVNFEVFYGGMMMDPQGNVKSGYEIKGSINRHDFGLRWNAITEAGGLVVGEDIKIDLNIQVMNA